jgi:ankyrin repeat protein
LKIAEMLLERVEQPERMDFVNQTGETTMRTALHMAASVNHEQMVKFLVKNGANKECMDKEVSRDWHGQKNGNKRNK